MIHICAIWHFIRSTFNTIQLIASLVNRIYRTNIALHRLTTDTIYPQFFKTQFINQLMHFLIKALTAGRFNKPYTGTLYRITMVYVVKPLISNEFAIMKDTVFQCMVY